MKVSLTIRYCNDYPKESYQGNVSQTVLIDKVIKWTFRGLLSAPSGGS